MSATKTALLQPIPYLSFDGDCADAMRFYERVLGGKITFMMTNGQSPMAEHFPPEAANRVLNCQLDLPGGPLLMGGDAMTNTPYEGVKGVSIALNFVTEAEGLQAFNALSEGGEVTMPWGPTFWAKSFGMVTDKFGIPWLVNGEMTSL